MSWKRGMLLLMTLLALLPAGALLAQDDGGDTINTDEAETTLAEPLPADYLMNGFTYHGQTWNNCGPATMTMALSYFGYGDGQVRAANFLKPDSQDKNVSPWQMAEFVNTQVPEIPVYAEIRYGGTLDTLRTLVSNNFPVIVEVGYDPERAAQGWMGHYLLVIGYDDFNQQFITHDSYDGPNLRYSYSYMEEFWQHFNYTYIVLHTSDREQELMDLLGTNADPYQNLINTFEIARAEATINPDDAFAWHNMGSVLVELAKLLDHDEYYEQAATAFDQARNVGEGLPWRMLWYQFAMYEAYNAVGRYQDTITLAQSVLNDGGGEFVEETYYYAGVAREGLGETQRAITNYQAAVNFNRNFTPAVERLEVLRG